MPPIKFMAFKRRAYIISLILPLSKIMPTCSYYIKKKLIYIIIAALFSCQPLSYIKCTKSNIHLTCDI